jgi:hypothetical protein
MKWAFFFFFFRPCIPEGHCSAKLTRVTWPLKSHNSTRKACRRQSRQEQNASMTTPLDPRGLCDSRLGTGGEHPRRSINDRRGRGVVVFTRPNLTGFRFVTFEDVPVLGLVYRGSGRNRVCQRTLAYRLWSGHFSRGSQGGLLSCVL